MTSRRISRLEQHVIGQITRNRRWLVQRLEWSSGVSPVTHREAAGSCWIRSFSHTLSLSHIHTHTNTHPSEVYECTSRWIMQSMVYACVNTFLCHGSWSMHPSDPQSPNRGKEAAWAQKKQTVQCRYTDRHRQTEPYIETVWPNEINKEGALCPLQHQLESKLWSWGVDGQAAEWRSVLQLAKLRGVSIYDSGIYDRLTDV